MQAATSQQPRMKPRERGGRHVRMAEELAIGLGTGRLALAELTPEQRHYVEWSRRTHGKIWKKHM